MHERREQHEPIAAVDRLRLRADARRLERPRIPRGVLDLKEHDRSARLDAVRIGQSDEGAGRRSERMAERGEGELLDIEIAVRAGAVERDRGMRVRRNDRAGAAEGDRDFGAARGKGNRNGCGSESQRPEAPHRMILLHLAV